MTALERANELYGLPRKEIPQKARSLAWHVCSEVGNSKDAVITAYAIYAQLEEGCKCPEADDYYHKSHFPSYCCVLRNM